MLDAGFRFKSLDLRVRFNIISVRVSISIKVSVKVGVDIGAYI